MKMQSFEVLDNPTRKKIILEFIKAQNDKLEYSDIKELVDKDTSRPDYHLNLLVEGGLIKRTKGRGFYKLNEISIQPLRNHFNEPMPICLMGGLGEVSLYTNILKNFEDISISPKKYILITSPERHDDFKKSDKDKYSKISTEIHEIDYQSILRENYPIVHDLLENLIKENIYEYEIICEITGGTKPVSTALFDLSMKYGLRKCYFSGRKIMWI